MFVSLFIVRCAFVIPLCWSIIGSKVLVGMSVECKDCWHLLRGEVVLVTCPIC